MTIPPRPRELPVAYGLLMSGLLLLLVWPIVGLPKVPVGEHPDPNILYWYVAGLPAALLVWLTPVAYRALGFIAPAGLMMFAPALYSFVQRDWMCPSLALMQGLGTGLVIGASLRYLFWLSRSVGRVGLHRDAFIRARNKTTFILGTIFMFLSVVSVFLQLGNRDDYRRVAEFKILILSGLILASGGTILFRPLFELTLEPIIWVMYRIRRAGPGLQTLPPFGSCLVIANHAAWLDPIFIEKALTRPITAIMTERFYNKWWLRPLLKYCFHVIVVPESPIRREAPEIQQAVEALDRGCCVMIFPEGYLRRKEEVPLRRFGQGVWQILQLRPETPVIACWIEGAWGSFCSYYNGPPTKNKRIDIRKPIGVGISSPRRVSAGLLAEHLRTRIFLMNLVSDARRHLGLEPLPPFSLPDPSSLQTPDHPENPLPQSEAAEGD